MKIYKNQTLQTAKDLGFYANFSFASDSIMSPAGEDVTPLSKDGIIIEYQETLYNKETGLATIRVYTPKEWINR